MIDQAKYVEKKNLPVVPSKAPYLRLSYLLNGGVSINVSDPDYIEEEFSSDAESSFMSTSQLSPQRESGDQYSSQSESSNPPSMLTQGILRQ